MRTPTCSFFRFLSHTRQLHPRCAVQGGGDLAAAAAPAAPGAGRAAGATTTGRRGSKGPQGALHAVKEARAGAGQGERAVQVGRLWAGSGVQGTGSQRAGVTWLLLLCTPWGGCVPLARPPFCSSQVKHLNIQTLSCTSRRELATQMEGVQFVDCGGAQLLQEDGRLAPELIPDALHPSAAGYEALFSGCWNAVVEAVLEGRP